MGKKVKLLLGGIVVVSVLIVGRVGIGKIEPEELDETERVAALEATPLVIDIPEQSKNGRVICYDKDGDIICQYYGEIVELNDGMDGSNRELVIRIPYSVD